MPAQDQRREFRQIFEARGWISWRNADGEHRQIRGYCHNISPTGLMVETAEPIPVGSAASVGTTQPAIQRTARVIRCEPIGERYAVGLEFIEAKASGAAS